MGLRVTGISAAYIQNLTVKFNEISYNIFYAVEVLVPIEVILFLF